MDLKCVRCQYEYEGEGVRPTVSPFVVYSLCPKCGKETMATRVGETAPSSPLRQTSPDPPTLEEVGLTLVPPPAPPGRLEAGLDAIEQAAGKWTEEEKAMLRRALRTVIERDDTFTEDAIYPELPADFPVTKGLSGLFRSASNAGIIEATGTVATSQRTDEHGHGQHLTVWRSLRRVR